MPDIFRGNAQLAHQPDAGDRRGLERKHKQGSVGHVARWLAGYRPDLTRLSALAICKPGDVRFTVWFGLRTDRYPFLPCSRPASRPAVLPRRRATGRFSVGWISSWRRARSSGCAAPTAAARPAPLRLLAGLSTPAEGPSPGAARPARGGRRPVPPALLPRPCQRAGRTISGAGIAAVLARLHRPWRRRGRLHRGAAARRPVQLPPCRGAHARRAVALRRARLHLMRLRRWWIPDEFYDALDAEGIGHARRRLCRRTPGAAARRC